MLKLFIGSAASAALLFSPVPFGCRTLPRKRGMRAIPLF